MRHTITTFSLFIVFVLSSTSAIAKIPPEVLDPYKAYAAAKESGDEKTAYENAKKAWQMAEKMIGDSKITGDLAHNFANLFSLDKLSAKNYKTRLKARHRSIELAQFYPKDEIPGVEVERTLKLAEMSLSLKTTKGSRTQISGGKGTYFDDVEQAIAKHGMQGGVFEGDLEVLKSRFYNMRKQYEKSLEHADRAAEIYKSPTDDYMSHYPYLLRVYKGDSFKALDQPILAALEYQSVMQNLEGKLPAEHPFVNLAFNNWMKTRSGLEDAGRLDEAERAGVCECWPFEDYKNKVQPIKRTPPKMPSKFMRGGNSGHVIVQYDVNDTGEPINIRAISSTSPILNRAATDSVKYWKYEKRGPDDEAKNWTGISTKISFRLMDAGGRILPE